MVQPASGQALPVRQVNTLEKGQTLLYKPVILPPDSAKAKLSLILVPAEQTQETQISVLEPQDASEPASWKAPFRVSVVGVVFGPQGLDKKKVSQLVRKDQDLVSQLASYAEQTQQVETLIQVLAEAEQGPAPGKNLEAALSGFAAQHGGAKLDRTQPTDQQAALLLHTLNPALGAYDPLAPQASARMQQSAGLAASVAGLFFGSTVGLAGGGAAMALNLRSLLSPDTEFRSALLQPQANQAVTLCSKRQPGKARTRLAYLWAARVPNAAAPTLALAASSAHLPAGLKSTLELAKGTDTKLLERARDWTLTGADGKSLAVPVKPGPAGTLEVDLTKAGVPAGTYKLGAKWDWDALPVQGDIGVHALSDLKKIAPARESADRLVQGAGELPLKLTGADFEFIEAVSLKRPKDSSPLEFKLPVGKRAGPQDSIEVALDTSKLKAGWYKLAFAHPDGASTEVPVRVLPPHPSIQNLPVRVNLGQTEQKVVLKGAGLDRIEGLQSEQVKVELAPAQPGQTTRAATIRPGSGLKKGEKLDLGMKVEGVEASVPVPGAIEVAGPLPKILVAKGSHPDELGVAVRDGELPAGSFVSISMQLENIEGQPSVSVRCADEAKALQPATLRPGTKQSAARLETAGQNLLFLSFEPGAFGQTGCPMVATVETEAAGTSEPYQLGTIIRLPRIESFTLTDEKSGENAYVGTLIGQDLETIEKTGWTATMGLAVDGLPKPVAGENRKQSLRIVVPWPSPAPRAPLYIWLRGETEGRVTRARY